MQFVHLNQCKNISKNTTFHGISKIQLFRCIFHAHICSAERYMGFSINCSIQVYLLMMHNSIITFITIEQNLDFLIFLLIFNFAHFNAHKYSFFTSISQAKTKGFMLSHGKIGDNEKERYMDTVYLYQDTKLKLKFWYI